MDLSIKTLRSRLDPFLSELGTLRYRHGAGLAPSPGLSALYSDFPELTRAETFVLVREALARPTDDPVRTQRLRILLELVASEIEEAACAPQTEAIAQLEASAQLVVAHSTQPFREAIAQLPLEPTRSRRDLMEQAIGNFLLDHVRPWAERVETSIQTARDLGFSSYEALRDEVSGFRARELLAQCDAVLRQTEDAYRDVLGYALKKLDPELRALPSGNARRHDLLRIFVAPWLLEYFRREDLLPSVQRCLEEMGFHPHANGRIQLDTEDRPTKSPRAFVAEVRVPDDIRLVMRPGQGLDDYFALLHEYGHALHFAHVSRDLPVEDRRLGDASVTEAWAFLFDHLLTDENWHRRYLRLSPPQARDSARVAAFTQLALLRRYCARLGYELSLYERGPSRDLADEYEERQSQALFVGAHKGCFLFDVDPQLYAARYLRGWALEARMHRALQERFDQDFYRNPATGRWLVTRFELGRREDAESISKELTGQPLSLEVAGERLVAILNR